MADSTLKGMRSLSNEEIMLMNDISDLGNQFGDLISVLENEPIIYGENDKELAVFPDPRWLAIGKTHLQQGIMCLKRAIGKPDNF